jgi:amidase
MAPVGEGWGGMSTQGVISRSVRDSALLLDLICQPQPGDPYWRDPPTIPYAACIDRPPERLRVGFSTISMLGDAIHPDCATAVEEAARLCEQLGHSVGEAALPYSFGAVGQATSSVISANVRANLVRIGEERGAPVTEDEVEAETWTLAEIGGGADAAGYVRSLQYLQAFTRSFAKSFEEIDVLITATIGHPAPPVGAFKGVDRSLTIIRAWAPNTTIFNVTGQPAMTLPLALSGDGLPIGVQMAARAGEEGLLFSLAAQIERAQPWTGLAIARSRVAE